MALDQYGRNLTSSSDQKPDEEEAEKVSKAGEEEIEERQKMTDDWEFFHRNMAECHTKMADARAAMRKGENKED